MNQRTPTVFQSLIPLVILLGLIMTTVLGGDADPLEGANQLSLLLASAVATVIAVCNRVTWTQIMQGIMHTVGASLPAILILLMVGMLSGSWMTAGIIPTMIYYGLEVLRPEYFLPACVVITGAVAVATGSSWSTIATIGVALIGIGQALGFSPAMSAGAIISGAYFGDKVSPLSDTTNLASAVTQTNVFVHIRYLMRTTVPSILLTICIFIVLTLIYGTGGSVQGGSELFQQTIASTYHVSAWLLLIPALVIFLIVKKIDAVPVLMIGAVIAAIASGIFQQPLLASLVPDGELTLRTGYEVVTRSMYGGISPQTGDPAVNELLSTGGMAGMLNTIWLIVTAMIFGGVMEAGHFLERITAALLRKVHSPGGLVTTATGTCLLFNVSSGDQYMSIVVPGKMFLGAFQRHGLEPRLLGRTLEDSATVTSVLIPWNTCGATQASILGVPTLVYLPYTFFCWLSPIMTLLFAWMGWGIRRVPVTETSQQESQTVPLP